MARREYGTSRRHGAGDLTVFRQSLAIWLVSGSPSRVAARTELLASGRCDEDEAEAMLRWMSVLVVALLSTASMGCHEELGIKPANGTERVEVSELDLRGSMPSMPPASVRC